MPNNEQREFGQREQIPTPNAEKSRPEDPIPHDGDIRVDENGNRVKYTGVGGWKEVYESDGWF